MINQIEKSKPSEFLEQKAKENGIVYPKKTVTEFLEENNGNYLNDIAIKYFGNDITYEELFSKINKYSKSFLSYGIKKGDYVSVCLPTIPEAIYIFYALNKIGAKFHTVLPTASYDQILEILKVNNSKMFITLDSLYYCVGDAIREMDVPFKIQVSANSSLPPVIKQFKIFSDTLKGLNDLLKGKHLSLPSDYLRIKDFITHGINTQAISCEWEDGKIAGITNSSGSTAQNKGTELTDYGFNAMVSNYKKALPDLQRGQTFHSCIPLLYSTGLSNSVNLPLQLGFPTILDPIFNKGLYTAFFMKNKPNLSIAPVPHAKELLNYLRKLYKEAGSKNRDLLQFVDVFSVGGSHLPVSWEEELEFYLSYFGSSAKVGKGYGLSEHNSALTVSVTKMHGACGIVLPGVIMGVFDPETGEELDFGQEGQLRAISPSDMAGYFNNEELTNQYFIDDETGKRWGHTGDIGRLELIDGNVWLFYSGREKDVVNIKGQNVLLQKIQEKVFECKLIDECEIVSAKDEEENRLVAHIVLKDNLHSQDEVLTNLKEIFANHEGIEPFAYKVHDSLPVLSSGKANKIILENDLENCVKLVDGRVCEMHFTSKVLKKCLK